MKKLPKISWLTLLLAVLAFGLINFAAKPLLRGARLDLTEGRLYTLSEGTRNILKGLEQPVTLRFYLSGQVLKDVPALQSYARRVEELLEEYQVLAGDRLRLETIDPRPFSEAEDDAVEAGLQGVPVGQGAETLYFGLVGEGQGGARQTISFFQPERERLLEYDLTQLIHNLAFGEKPTVGLLSSIAMSGGFSPQNPMGRQPAWMVVEQLRQRFNLRELDQETTRIAEDIDVLMVVGPSQLDERALYALDQYVLRGGHALVFVDPLSEASRAANPGGISGENEALGRLLQAWGVEHESGKVVADLSSAQRVTISGGTRPQTIEYLPWLAMRGDRINRQEIATAQLGQLNLASAGAFERAENATTEFVPLLQSSEQAMLIDRSLIAFAPDPARLLADFKASGVTYTLAARLIGPVRTAFADGPPQSKPKDEGQGDAEAKGGQDQLQPHLAEAEVPANLILVADSDLLEDRFWVEVRDFFGQRLTNPIASNADFAINALELLGGSSDLISVRSRGESARPFELVAEIQRRAEQQYRAKEQELVARLQETETRLSQLQNQRDDAGNQTLTPEQEQEVETFLAEKVRIRKQLREVQFRLREDIEELEGVLKAFNIGLVPMLIALVAFISWLLRRSRKRGYAD